MNAWVFMRELHKVCHFGSRERTGEASAAELRRWLENGAIQANGEKLAWDEEMDFPIGSFVLFPASGKRVTLL